MIKKGTVGISDEPNGDATRLLLMSRYHSKHITQPESIGWIRIINLLSGTYRYLKFSNDNQYYDKLESINGDNERVDYVYLRYKFKANMNISEDDYWGIGEQIYGWLSRSKTELEQELTKCQNPKIVSL